MRVDEHTIDVDGSPAFYRLAGDAPILYLHGIPTSSDDWLPFLERSGGIAPDLIGFGRSGKGGHLDYSLGGHADFIERVLAELEIEDELRIVAHGWGAGGGLVFAQRHPERIAKLVLINALPLFGGFAYGRLANVWRRPLLGELAMGCITKRLLGRELRRGCVNPRAWSSERIASVWKQFDQGTQRAILRLHRSTGPERLRAAGSDLDAVGASALVIWGEQDPWFGAEYADAYAARLADAHRIRLKDAGHWPWLDDPSVVETVGGYVSST